jgi:hypothetical protein
MKYNEKQKKIIETYRNMAFDSLKTMTNFRLSDEVKLKVIEEKLKTAINVESTLLTEVE